jgi:hypothetical protein
MRLVSAAFLVLLAATPAFAQTTLERGNNNEAFAIAVSRGSNRWEAGRVPVAGNLPRAQQQAEQGAMRQCGPDCMVLLRFGPAAACMVLARGTPGWGGAYASSPEAARSQAMADCQAHNQNCRILTAAWCYR